MNRTKQSFIEDYLAASYDVLQAFIRDKTLHKSVLEFSEVIVSSFSSGGKLLIAGNGGSAADAQHMAGEFVSRLFFEHEPLPAIALTTDTSVLTAIGNDYGYEQVFERQVRALGRSGDIFLGISTSGKSPNILRAFDAARKKGLVTLGLTGAGTGPMDELCDNIFHAPAQDTALIQQVHIIAIHLICGLVGKQMFGSFENSKAAQPVETE
jgi:D-sedoheptulose 7-phosphate isomerase